MRLIFNAVVCCVAVSLTSCVAKAAPPTENVPAPAKQADAPVLDVVFVLDTTSSMSGLIDGAKQKIWSIASNLAAGKPTPKIRVGLVAFRDRGDEYVTKRFDLSEDLDALYRNLTALEVGGGGDGPEHVGQGLGEAVKFTTWSQSNKALKMIFVVGDAPPHDDYKDEWNSSLWAKKAIQKGIVVNTVRCGQDTTTESSFRSLAMLADGTFVSIAQEGGMVATATPFDGEMAELNRKLADTAVVAGSGAARRESKEVARAQAAMPAAAAADRVRFFGNLGVSTPTASATEAVDLAAAPAKLKSMRTESLPEPMQAMSEGEREAYVTKQAATRKDVEEKLNVLNEKRNAFLAAKPAAKKDSFDEEVFRSVKSKAAKVGLKY